MFSLDARQIVIRYETDRPNAHPPLCLRLRGWCCCQGDCLMGAKKKNDQHPSLPASQPPLSRASPFISFYRAGRNQASWTTIFLHSWYFFSLYCVGEARRLPVPAPLFTLGLDTSQVSERPWKTTIMGIESLSPSFCPQD